MKSLGVAESYAHCERLARRSASSFYYPFLLFPRRKRRSMCALYAFLRHTDDLGDSTAPVDERRTSLARWRQSLDRALAGEFDSALLPALADTMRAFDIPREYLEHVIDGVEQDLQPRRFETFEQLAGYCDLVASAVGFACLRIWECDSPQARLPARSCGLAFQMTNILRDLKEDAQRDRVYLPQEDLERFGYSVDDLRAGVRDQRFRALMKFEIERTEVFYAQAVALGPLLHSEERRVLGSMIAIYRALLDEIKRRDGDVLSANVRLSRWRKMRIAASWLLFRPPVSSAEATTP